MEQLPQRHILISVDESQAAKKSLDWTLENLYKPGDLLHLFHVISPGSFIILSTDLGVEEVVEDDEETQRRVEDHAREYLTKEFGLKLEEKKVPFQLEIVRFATDNDSIGSIICKRADQLNATAVVMAKHNKGTLKEFFVGSVCNYCTHHCKSPVLVMHCD